MNKRTYRFSTASVDVYHDATFAQLGKMLDKKKTIIITDEHIFKAHGSRFSSWRTIVLKPGESFKIQATVDSIITQLIAMQADRKSTLVGVGGGVVTDITGYVASIYMRGLSFGFVPTSLLAMVDASIGGKNGIDVGEYKNMVGVIRQPDFLLYDYSFLKTLPLKEWSNGFAEIIKHACIGNRKLFKLLGEYDLDRIRKKPTLMKEIIKINVHYKSMVVKNDEFESGNRKLLNFGHTLGHALETQYELTHGQAVSLGMIFASWMSGQILGFKNANEVESLLVRYQLPTRAAFDVDKVFNILQMDKKRVSKTMNYILLEKTGKGVIHQIPVKALRDYLESFNAINQSIK